MNKETFTILLVLIIGIAIGYLASTLGDKEAHSPLEESHMHETMDSMTSTLQSKEGQVFDEAFLSEMILHHEGALEMAELVLEKSNRGELKTFAEGIIDAQSKEIEIMKEWRREWFNK